MPNLMLKVDLMRVRHIAADTNGVRHVTEEDLERHVHDLARAIEHLLEYTLAEERRREEGGGG